MASPLPFPLAASAVALSVHHASSATHLAAAWSLAVIASLTALWAVRDHRRTADRALRAERQSQWLIDFHERRQLLTAKAIHDGPVQDLLAMKMFAGVGARGESVTHRGQDAVKDSAWTTTMRDLREVNETLRQPALEHFGLAAAVTSCVARFRRRHPDISVALDLDDDALPARSRLFLMRIVQEALDNAVKHGAPLRVDITLVVSPDETILTIGDDGVGFTARNGTAFAESGRYGLLAMGAYADAVGADLSLESVPGRTVVCIRVPIHTSSPT